MSRWFGRSAKSQPAMIAEDEEKHLQQVEHALLQLLNDDIAQADRILKNADSSYHYLGRGISSYIAAMLGVEKELLKDAAAALAEAESKSYEDMKRAQREPTAFQSHIYPPGTEYQLCYAISQLTSAVCAVLSGSITQAMGGFLKLRTAFLTLDAIMEIEADYLKKQAGSRRSSMASQPVHSSHANMSHQNGSLSDSIRDMDLTDEKPSPGPVHPSGKVSTDQETDLSDSIPPLSTATRVDSRMLDVDPASIGITSHTDIFIHSGTRLCHGSLLLVFSMIENPLFNRILYIVGFKGDRERGTRYLWQSARFNNFNSAIAGITLLAFYNGLVGSCEILPTDPEAEEDISGYPIARCRALLRDMCKRYPESKLWKLEEARMHASSRNLTEAVNILVDNSQSNMKQITTINMFELSLTAMCIHDYELCAKSWLQCAEVSQWSPTLYAYITGASYLEIYRNLCKSDPIAAATYKIKAAQFFRKAPPLAGRQKVMAKQLPFDMYITRKVQKWEERAKTWNVDLVDAIGVSPLVEMIYFWGGFKKQADKELQQSINILQWARTGQPEKHEVDVEEVAIHALLSASLLRNMKLYEEARTLLQTKVLNNDRQEFQGELKDDWMLPSANYEMACISWHEKDDEGQDSTAKVLECEEWVAKTKNWGEQYILDTRVSVKIATSLATLRRHRKIMGI